MNCPPLKTVFVVLLFMTVLVAFAGAPEASEDNLFAALQQKLIDDGFDAEMIKGLYERPDVHFDPEGVSVFFVYRESTLNYDQFTAPQYIKRAKEYIQRHHTAFEAAESAYGVDKEVIAAIILVETKLGAYVGYRSVINSLSTMASLETPAARRRLWDQVSDNRKLSRKKFEQKALRRAKWAYKELKAFLTYSAQENIDPAEIRGSFAGALGVAQFMPTSILAYAQDGNQDKRIDLFDHADAIASVASYLKSFGWKPGISTDSARKVVWHYNRSSYYVDTVLKIARLLKG